MFACRTVGLLGVGLAAKGYRTALRRRGVCGLLYPGFLGVCWRVAHRPQAIVPASAWVCMPCRRCDGLQLSWAAGCPCTLCRAQDTATRDELPTTRGELLRALLGKLQDMKRAESSEGDQRRRTPELHSSLAVVPL